MNGPGGTAGATATPTSMPSNWDIAQTVTVTGVDNTVEQSSDRRVTIAYSAGSMDPDYTGASLTSVTATVVDDDRTFINICSPIPQVEAKVLRILGKIEADCNNVTPAELREITTLLVTEDTSLTALKDGDFNDLISLRILYLDDNRLRSLPSVMVDSLTNSPA